MGASGPIHPLRGAKMPCLGLGVGGAEPQAANGPDAAVITVGDAANSNDETGRATSSAIERTAVDDSATPPSGGRRPRRSGRAAGTARAISK